MNSFLVCEEGKASTSSNFTQKEKQREQDRLHKNDKEGQDSFSLCDDEEEGYKEERKEESKREEKERIIRISEAVERETSNRINESEPEEFITFILRGYSGRFISSSRIKSHEEQSTCESQGRTVILDLTTDKSDYEQGSCVHFFNLQRKLPDLKKGQTITL